MLAGFFHLKQSLRSAFTENFDKMLLKLLELIGFRFCRLDIEGNHFSD